MDPGGSSRNSPVKEVEKKQNASLPEGDISEILGLLEILKSKNGRDDIYKLAKELNMELGDTLTVIRGAELLKLVNTPGGDVVLEKLGEDVSRARISERKELLCQQVEQVPVIKKITTFLKEREDHQAEKQEVLDKLAELLPNADAEDSFQTVVEWGRYAELFGFNDDTETFYLDDEEEE